MCPLVSAFIPLCFDVAIPKAAVSKKLCRCKGSIELSLSDLLIKWMPRKAGISDFLHDYHSDQADASIKLPFLLGSCFC